MSQNVSVMSCQLIDTGLVVLPAIPGNHDQTRLETCQDMTLKDTSLILRKVRISDAYDDKANMLMFSGYRNKKPEDHQSFFFTLWWH